MKAVPDAERFRIMEPCAEQTGRTSRSRTLQMHVCRRMLQTVYIRRCICIDKSCRANNVLERDSRRFSQYSRRLTTIMTISTNSTAPLIVVVGATGMQGGSVITNLEASNRPYRIRGLTRDVQKISARQLSNKHVEVVSCTVSVGEERQVQKAFAGATYVFVSRASALSPRPGNGS